MMGPSHQGLQLRGDLRQACENYMGAMVSGPWEDVIEAVATAVEESMLSASEAARLDLALRRTQGVEHPTCQVCDCPCPGLTHY